VLCHRVPGTHHPRGKLRRGQVPNRSSPCSQAGGEGGFSQQWVGEQAREAFRTQKEEERIAACSKCFAAVRGRAGAGGERGPAAQRCCGGTGRWAASPAGGQKGTSPATGTCATQPNRAVGAPGFVSRIVSQGNPAVLPLRKTFCEVSKCP